MRCLVALFAVLASTSVASAESSEPAPPLAPNNAYVAAGAEVGIERWFMSGVHIDAGKRIGSTPLFLHARVAAGVSGGEGSYQQLRGGAEARGCIARDWVCAFAGFDLGYQHDKYVDHGADSTMTVLTDANDLLMAPRGGIEVGQTVRVRAEIDGLFYKKLGSDYIGNGAALSLGLGYSF